MSIAPTQRLYLDDDHRFDTDAVVIAVRDATVAVDRTCFYPGGGGQPADQGRIELPDGSVVDITSIRADADGVIWHVCAAPPPPGIVGVRVRLVLDRERRLALARYHTVLHVLNTIARNDYGAWITGVQIGTDYSRIDFKWEGFSTALCAELERKVNAVLDANRPLRSYYIAEDEFRRRDDLLRTLEVKPPVVNGRVRVVEIAGFDAQACGGTHVPATSAVGRFSIFRTENKGRINKRLYVQLGRPVLTVSPSGARELFW
jgi:misacylated tRNA(Ala) deacylase